ncbi:hypothetical protein NDA16_002506 [Ustilago loliicola]|nr:hypothetical protein NDA16_002506 [Ustilago loliicola]
MFTAAHGGEIVVSNGYECKNDSVKYKHLSFRLESKDDKRILHLDVTIHNAFAPIKSLADLELIPQRLFVNDFADLNIRDSVLEQPVLKKIVWSEQSKAWAVSTSGLPLQIAHWQVQSSGASEQPCNFRVGGGKLAELASEAERDDAFLAHMEVVHGWARARTAFCVDDEVFLVGVAAIESHFADYVSEAMAHGYVEDHYCGLCLVDDSLSPSSRYRHFND